MVSKLSHHPHPLPEGWTRRIADDHDIGLPFLLWRARQAAVSRLLPVLGKRRLTEPQWRLLRMLQFFGGPLLQRDLSRAGGFYPGHVGRMAEHLYAHRCIEWFKSNPRRATHRQRWKIGITPYGHKLIADVQADLRAGWRDTSNMFSEADRAQLSELLMRYVESVLWKPGNSEAANYDPLFASRDKHDRRSVAGQKVKYYLKRAAKRGFEPTVEQVRAVVFGGEMPPGGWPVRARY